MRSETSARNGENQDDDHETEGMSTSCDVILIHCLLMSPMPGTVEPVTFKNAALARFSSAQITAAKTVLWQESMHDVIGPVPKRRITVTRTIEVANVLDILEALQKLDRAGRLPSIAILFDLGLIPRAHPEEVLLISMADRMNRMEHRMTELMDLVERLVSENVEMRAEMSHVRVATPQEDVSLPQPPPCPTSPDKKKKKKKKGKTAPLLACRLGTEPPACQWSRVYWNGYRCCQIVPQSPPSLVVMPMMMGRLLRSNEGNRQELQLLTRSPEDAISSPDPVDLVSSP